MNIELYQSPSFDPYVNLGVEEILLETCPKDTLRFYLWQNAHTVVIGKNQHAQSEVAIVKLLEDEGKLARRSSGGGAVYHDLGNVNFTFILEEKNYDVQKQMRVIARALGKLGFNAVVSGRNDIEIDGAKVSGNAFLKRDGYGLHHGTILFNVDKEKLGKYLTVSEAKLRRKSVESVKARIMNLCDIKPVSLDEVKQACLEAVGEEYGEISQILPFPMEEAMRKIATFESTEWLYGTHFEKQLHFETYLSFGSIRWEFESENNAIIENRIYSDAMDVSWVENLQNQVMGIVPDPRIIADHLDKMEVKDDATIELIAWLRR